MSRPADLRQLGRRCLRSAVSYVPSRSLLTAREVRDLPARLLHRVHEPDFALLRYWDAAPSTVLDVGANRGQSIRSLRMVLQGPRVVAVEPHAHLARHLRRRFRGADVDVVACGLGDSDGRLELHVPVYGHTAWDTRAAASPALAGEFLSAESFVRYDPARAQVVPVTIDIRRLDDLGVAPDIIKIDVEGADLGVVRGGFRTIRENRPVLLIEEPSPETVELLADIGYAPFTAAGQHLRRGRENSLNTFFLTGDHEQRLPAGTVR